jgi:hypothetical protein
MAVDPMAEGRGQAAPAHRTDRGDLGGDGRTLRPLLWPRPHHGDDLYQRINDNIVVCVLEDILSTEESDQIADGDSSGVIDGRVAFQVGAEDEFTATVERLTRRKVTAFLSANQTDPGIASEIFFLEAPPVVASDRS